MRRFLSAQKLLETDCGWELCMWNDLRGNERSTPETRHYLYKSGLLSLYQYPGDKGLMTSVHGWQSLPLLACGKAKRQGEVHGGVVLLISQPLMRREWQWQDHLQRHTLVSLIPVHIPAPFNHATLPSSNAAKLWIDQPYSWGQSLMLQSTLNGWICWLGTKLLFYQPLGGHFTA